MFRLDGDIAVVTGAKGRLGSVWVEALLEAGARVAVLDLAGAPASPGFEQISRASGADRLVSCDCDITDRQSIVTARDHIVSVFGPPAVLINNAAIDQPPDPEAPHQTIETLPIGAFRRVVEVNLMGTFQMTQLFGSLMADRGHGSIINIGSIYASVSPDQRYYRYLPGDPPFLKPPAYGASKAGVVNLTKYFSTLWASRGVRVNTFSPGGVLGSQDAEFRRAYCERVPMGRMALADDLKGPLVFLASPASSYVTGIELRADGGYTVW